VIGNSVHGISDQRPDIERYLEICESVRRVFTFLCVKLLALDAKVSPLSFMYFIAMRTLRNFLVSLWIAFRVSST